MKRFPCLENQKERFWSAFHIYKMHKYIFETLSFLQNEKSYSCGVGRDTWWWSGWRIYKSNKRDLNRFSFIQVKLHNFEVFSFYQIKCTFLKRFHLSKATQNCSNCSKLPNTEYCPNKLPSGQKLLKICTNNSLEHIFDHVWGP